MNDLKIKELDLLQISGILNDFEHGKGVQRDMEKLLLFTEYNKGCLESRIGELWGKEHIERLYISLIKGFENTWRLEGDIRFLNIILKLSNTKYFLKLQKFGSISENEFGRKVGEVK